MTHQLPLPWVVLGSCCLACGLGWHTLLGAVWSVLSSQSVAPHHAQVLLLLLVILVVSVSGAGDNRGAVVWVWGSQTVKTWSLCDVPPCEGPRVAG